MEVTIKGSTIVRPAQETPKGSLWCSNLDILTTYHLPMLYYYKPNGCSDFFDPGRLKEALCKILVSFYPIAGRLGYDKNGRLEISCNAQGVLFVEAETTSIMDPLIADFSENSQVFRLVPEVDYSGGISSFPLLVVQVTKFICGGVCLGVGLQHSLGDGAMAIHFINSWADTARGSSPAIAPFIDRTLLRARDPPTVKFHHVEHDPPPSMKSTLESHSDDPKSYIVSTFKLTVDQLNTLKAKANSSSATKYSAFKILAAHIWRCISKARGLSGDQATKLSFPVDGRSRLNPPLPPGYLGKVIFLCAVVSQAGDLESESFTGTIQRIHEQLNQINDEYLRSALDYLEKVSDLSSLNRGPHTHRCPNLAIIPWNRFPIYDADFGWGRPVYMGPGDIVREGKVYILPSPTNDGSLYVVTCLETSQMKLFEKFLYDFHFIEHKERKLSRI
ncbi:hydroxycinnamoyl-CoA shikimate/quinate hydroxycinnamoyl transferase [Hibiscus trionum]|uniref:Hydroxycinnamoyl-CoA shikimate/quinate hydroxycinnamoyl transferase n=1 Tax=Hibiscus trionum TaxID=183268 RepID=A0A9W7MC90_HIBTR|nr:hydroxycinnamoyl-CoA shikimate/quinate hydroxycinnamoyl transferase [Hibiscus trionum]